MNGVSQNDVHEVTGDFEGVPRGKRRVRRTRPLLWAYLSLLLFMVIYCARPEDWIPSLTVVPLAKISGVLALAALIFSVWSIRQRLPREVIYLGLLTGQLFTAALLSSVWRGGAVQKALDFAKVLLIVVVIVLSVRTIARLRQLVFVQAVSVAVIAAVTVWKGHLLLGRLVGVLGSNYADPNDLALAIVISLPLCLALLLLSKGPFRKCFWAAAIVMMIYAVILTGSRGGGVALAVTIIVCLWEFSIRRRQLFLLLVAVLAAVVFWQFSSGLLSGRLRGTFDSTQDTAASYDSGQARMQLLSRSIAITAEHPLFGVGPGNFQQVSGMWHETHNAFTQISSEGGLPAFFLYALIVWTGFRNLRRIKRLARSKRRERLLAGALNSALAGYVVGSLFLSVAYEFFPYFLVAYTTALLVIVRQSAARSGVRKSGSEPAPHEASSFPVLVATDC